MMQPITNTAHLNQQGPGVSRSARLADFFRYHGLWAPGVRLFRRLRFRAKALILSAMFIIPIALLSWQYFGDKLALIAFTNGERQGVQALTHFIEVQHGLVRLRAAQTAVAQGLNEAAPEVDSARAQVNAGLDRLMAQASQSRDSMNLKPVVTDVIQRWQSTPSTDDPALQASIKALLDHIGDASGLVLDPDLDSFYLMKAVVFTLPGAMDDLGHLWTWGTFATIKAGLGTEQERRWQLWTAGLTEAEEELQHAYSRASSHNTALRQQVAELNLQKGLALAVQGEQAVFGEGGVQPPSFFQDGQSATTDLKSMYLRTLPMLDELLAQREIRLRQAALGTALVLIISLFVAWYLFLSFRKVLEGGLNEVAYHIDEMRAGNLTTDPRAWGHDEAARLMITLKDMQASLRLVVSQVRDAAETIVHASREIASGSSDLSNRTAQSAERLQLSAAAMETVSATVEQTAQSAAQASTLAGTNAQAATDGGQIIHSVINTMSEIQDASRQIHEIVGTIDSIAFQTNILALNAAVEAARAGEQGRGFAVVASEVRALAQRTSTAAREVKRLIGSSVDKVDAGGAVVREAGQSMQHIVTHAQQVNDLLTEIASGARDQATGVQQTAQAVQALEDATQQNASLVEQTAAAAASLREQAQRLADGVAVFKLG